MMSFTIQKQSSYTANQPDRVPLRVSAYCRVSTDLQREKNSIQTQVEMIESYCVEKGYTLVETYCDDGVSGTIHLHDRPSGRRLIEDARQGKFAAIIVYKADRVGRDVLVNEIAIRTLYDELRIDFIGIAETIDLATPIGRAMFTFQSAIGRLERENTLQRSRDATLRLAKDGVWLGGIVPYGYRQEGKDREARLVVSDTVIPHLGITEADVIRLIYSMSGELGATCIEIAKRLNDMGVPTAYTRDNREVLRGKRREKTSGLWSSGRVRNILVETIYKGIHTWGRRGSKRRQKGAEHVTIERQMPAIVDGDLWQRAQVTMQNNSLSSPDIIKRKYLLRGLITCSECGRSFIGTVSDGKKMALAGPEELAGAEVRGDRLLKPYYHCNGKNASSRLNKETGQTGPKCGSSHLRATDAEGAVWEQVKEFITAPDAILAELAQKLAERGGDAALVEKELARIEAEVEEQDAQRAMLFRLFRKGSMSEGDLERQLAETTEEEKELNAQAEKLRGAAKLAGGAKATLESVRGFLGRLEAKLKEQNGEPGWEVKRRLIEALVERIVISSQVDPTDARGRRRTHTLRLKYNFEDPRPTKTPSGLVLEKELVISGTYMSLKKEAHAELVRGVLSDQPDLTLDQISVAIEEKYGKRMAPSTLCRLRAKVGLSPNTPQSRAGKTTFTNRHKSKTP